MFQISSLIEGNDHNEVFLLIDQIFINLNDCFIYLLILILSI